MKIVIVGGGIAGLYAAWHLSEQHEVVLLEADERLGGHADTHHVDDKGVERAIDSGFIVFNEHHYPLFTEWLQKLGVAWRDSDMSFAVSDPASGLAYNAASLGDLFCQRRNLLSPSFIGMVRDMLRFYRAGPALLETVDDRITLGEWLDSGPYGRKFADYHLLPMASALWSAPMGRIREFPVRHLLAFMNNHAMLQLRDRPPWRTVEGGSARYVEAAVRCPARFETARPVRRIERGENGVRVHTDNDELNADAVVLACHSDQALELLADPNRAEQMILGAIGYQPNEAVLHTDDSLLPADPRARASWNVRRDPDDREHCRVTYSMNRLQGIDSSTEYLVSLNQAELIDPDRILVRRHYSHPVFTPEAVVAQRRWSEINGLRRTWYCGAWWGWGFHEDGARSARRVVDAIEASHG